MEIERRIRRCGQEARGRGGGGGESQLDFVIGREPGWSRPAREEESGRGFGGEGDRDVSEIRAAPRVDRRADAGERGIQVKA